MMQQTQPLQDNKEDIIAQLLAQNDELLKALQDCVVEMDTLKQRVQNVDRTDSSTMTDGARLAVDSSMQVDEGTLDMHKLVEDLLVSSLESVVDDTTMDTVSLSADLIAIPSEPEESMMNMRVPTLEAKHADNPVDIAPPVTPISARPDSVQREVMEFAAVGLRNVLPVDEDESEKDVAAAVQDAVELEEKDVAATVPEVIVSSDDSDHVSTMRSVPTTLNGSKRIALQKRDKDVNESTRPRRVSTTVTTTTTMTTSMKRSSRRRSRFNSDATGPSTFRASITEEQVRKATYAFKRMSLAMKAPSDEHATIADTEEVILARPRQSMFSSPHGNTLSPIIEGVAVEVKADALLPASARSPLSGSQIPATDPASIPATPEERIAMLSAIGVDLHATVRNSTICLNAQGKEYLTFVIGVSRHTENMDHQVWSVQKRYTDLAGLHDLLCKTQSMEVMRSIGKDVVHKSLFALGDVSPSRAAKRKQTLQRYLNAAIDSVLTAAENIEPLLWFFSTNVVELEGTGSAPVFNDSLKEGYLTKKGQKLGGWKRRYFVLRADTLDYYESKETAYKSHAMINGSVQLRGARLAKQRASAQPDGSTDTPFRHALMLADLSGKKNILCADSDLDRDEWVFLVARQVELLRIEKDRDEHQRKAMVVPSHIAAAVPLQTPASTKPIHFAGPTIVEPEQNEQPELVQHSRRPSRSRMASIRSTITRTLIPSRRSSAASKSEQPMLGYSGPSRVFGVPLDEAIKFSSFSNGISVLPSIVYRCIQFLEHSGAYTEEGLYRLSGSSNEIKDLRAMFERDGDVDLLALSPRPDIHVIAGLFKLWLRELPESLLTAELQRDFHVAAETSGNPSQCSDELAQLVARLPSNNVALLRTLLTHLNAIVAKRDVNRMTSRNVQIVFVPTLGISGGLLMHFMERFNEVFFVERRDDEGDSAVSSAMTLPTPISIRRDVGQPPAAVRLSVAFPEDAEDVTLVQQLEFKRRSRVRMSRLDIVPPPPSMP